MDGWMVKPANFDSTKKYPVLFLCLWRTGCPDGAGFLWQRHERPVCGNMGTDGYIYMSLDNRGSPARREGVEEGHLPPDRKAEYQGPGDGGHRDPEMALRGQQPDRRMGAGAVAGRARST